MKKPKQSSRQHQTSMTKVLFRAKVQATWIVFVLPLFVYGCLVMIFFSSFFAVYKGDMQLKDLSGFILFFLVERLLWYAVFRKTPTAVILSDDGFIVYEYMYVFNIKKFEYSTNMGKLSRFKKSLLYSR